MIITSKNKIKDTFDLSDMGDWEVLTRGIDWMVYEIELMIALSVNQIGIEETMNREDLIERIAIDSFNTSVAIENGVRVFHSPMSGGSLEQQAEHMRNIGRITNKLSDSNFAGVRYPSTATVSVMTDKIRVTGSFESVMPSIVNIIYNSIFYLIVKNTTPNQ